MNRIAKMVASVYLIKHHPNQQNIKQIIFFEMIFVPHAHAKKNPGNVTFFFFFFLFFLVPTVNYNN